jgi:hypothetical protein
MVLEIKWGYQYYSVDQRYIKGGKRKGNSKELGRQGTRKS